MSFDGAGELPFMELKEPPAELNEYQPLPGSLSEAQLLKSELGIWSFCAFAESASPSNARERIFFISSLFELVDFFIAFVFSAWPNAGFVGRAFRPALI